MRITYRPEIDGLRSIAVFSVIFYHANFILFNKSFLPGGFLGVDIFFVISGYLITSIILKEIYTKNSFSFKNFYVRRIRRIIPALLFVMLCTLPFAYIILLEKPIIDFSKSILSSIFFISNIYFNFTGNRYGEESTLFKPFLHTWSLSVEEQFYILFPFFLVIAIKFFKKYLLFFLIIGFLISIFFSQYARIYHPSFNFYMILSRGFELLIGSLLSYFEINNVKRNPWGGGWSGQAVPTGEISLKIKRIFNLILPKVGISLIIYSFLFFDINYLLPSFYSIIPLLGTCLIISFSNKDEIINKFLSNKILVFFGLISYSLYLFHYPIFAFSRLFEIFDNNKILFILLTIIISIFSYYYIEKPFRDKNKISFKKILTILLSLVTFLILFNLYIIKKDGIKSRLPKVFQQELNKDTIEFFQKDNLPKVVLIGDSHAADLQYYLNKELKKNSFSLFRFSTRIYLHDFNYISLKTKEIDKDFIKNNNEITKFLKENKNLIVIFHQRWPLIIHATAFNNEEGYKEYKKEENKYFDYLEPIGVKTKSQKDRELFIIEGIKLQIYDIINQGHKLILVYPVPEMGFEPYKLLYSRYKKKYLFDLDQSFVSILSGSFEVYQRRNKSAFELLNSIQSPNIYRIYPHTYFCNKKIENRCIANTNEHLFYYDSNHLSLEGSKYVVDDIIKIIKEIEVNRHINLQR